MADLRIHSSDDNRNHSIVAEFIRELSIQAYRRRIFPGLLHLRSRIAARRQIELVALIGELRNSGQIHRQKIVNNRLHLKALQILAVIRKGRSLRRALCVLHIHGVAPEIVFIQGYRFKKAAAVQGNDVVLHVVHNRSAQPRYLRLRDSALGRIVIHKHDGFRQNVQFGSDVRQIAVFVFPVGPDRDKILRMEHPFRMAQAVQGIFQVVLGADRQQDARFLHLPDVRLKLIIALRDAGFLANLYAVDAVIADHASPERIVQVQRQRLFVPPEYGLDQICGREGILRYGIQAHAVFIHIPVIGIQPFPQAVIRSRVGKIMHMKIAGFSGVGIDLLIQSCDKVSSSPEVGAVTAAEDPVKRRFKIVLYDRAAEIAPQMLPDFPEACRLPVQLSLHILRTVGHRRELADISGGSVQKYQIRLKLQEFPVREYGLLFILRVLALIEHRLYAIVQKKQLHAFYDITGGRAAEHRDPLGKTAAAILQKLSAERFLLPQDLLGIKGVLQFFHAV